MVSMETKMSGLGNFHAHMIVVRGGWLGGWSFPLGCGAPVDFMEEQFCLASEKSANIYDEGSEMFLLLQAG